MERVNHWLKQVESPTKKRREEHLQWGWSLVKISLSFSKLSSCRYQAVNCRLWRHWVCFVMRFLLESLFFPVYWLFSLCKMVIILSIFFISWPSSITWPEKLERLLPQIKSFLYSLIFLNFNLFFLCKISHVDARQFMGWFLIVATMLWLCCET